MTTTAPPAPPVTPAMWEALRVPDEWLPRDAPAGHRLTVGVRSAEADTWLAPRAGDEHLLAWKRQLLGSSLVPQVVGVTEGSAAACEAAVAAVRGTLDSAPPVTGGQLADDPEAPALSTPGDAGSASRDGRAWQQLRNVAGLVVEDLCVLDVSGAAPVLVAGALAMPNRWSLADKLGRPLLDVHDPVPGYRESIGAATDRVLTGLRPGRVLARTNWGISDRPDLYQPAPPAGEAFPPSAAPAASFGPGLDALWLRIEYQTLVALPEASAVLFTIRTAQERLDTLLERRPPVAGVLARLTADLPAELAAYKGVGAFQDRLVAELRSRAESA